MTNSNYTNEQIKRQFFEHLKGGKGFASVSVRLHAEALAQWETFTKYEDFASYDKSKAIAFTEWINTRPSNTKSGKVSLATQYNYLRRIKKFFTWLSDQPKYRSKISKNDVEFLRLSKKDARIATSGTTKRMPTFDEVKKTIEGIEVRNEIDMRDKALISFALITGARISAIISLKMKNFDKTEKRIDQNPGDGVRTKNSKKILTTFFPIGWDEPEKSFMEWYEYLESKKGFGSDDPIFPATEGGFGDPKHDYNKEDVGKEAWAGTSAARKIFEKRFKNAYLPYFHPHSFRHLVVSIMSKQRLTEEEKRAISLNLGHEHVATTFGSYGYGSMGVDRAVDIVRELRDFQNSSGTVEMPEEVRAFLKRLIDGK